ncbi:MAG TPA: FecR domain-containing protein [Solimonas sp.]|nr:FecR domain-containing protein [Solimonas sp.]
MKHSRMMAAAAALLLVAGAVQAKVEPAGMFKRVEGEVRVERAGATLPASVGMALYATDTVVTGSGGSAGITFDDNTLMSLGPASRLAINQFRFNSTTHEGRFESTLSKGRLAVVSGKIAKHEQDAMKVRTPSSVLGVRGTEFIVEAGE